MEGFADIEGPVLVGLAWLFALAAAGLLVLLLLAFAIRLWVRRSRSRQADGSVHQRSPLEIALERLQVLQKGGTDLEADPFIVEVSDIVRDYLERALSMPAREQTSEEFLNDLQKRADLPQVLKDRMPQFLDQCDLVKFARQSLAGQQRDDLIDTANTVVVETDATLQVPEGEPSREEAAV
mgnify:CR=1 FL=1